MKNPWLQFILLRVGSFVVAFAILASLRANIFLSALIAAILSLAFSLLFFNRQRAKVSEAIYNRVKKNDELGADDPDSDLENAILDEAEGKN